MIEGLILQGRSLKYTQNSPYQFHLFSPDLKYLSALAPQIGYLAHDQLLVLFPDARSVMIERGEESSIHFSHHDMNSTRYLLRVRGNLTGGG